MSTPTSEYALYAPREPRKLEGLPKGPTLIQRAYDAILGAICDHTVAPGERLNQDELAASLHISRQPVGQALSILKAQGFVRDNGRRGLIVAPLERDFFRSIYELREALDPMAARLAAGRCSPDDAAEGRRIIAEGRKAVRGSSMDALTDADLRFHMWIYRLAGNPLLVETMALYWNHLRRAMAEILRTPLSRVQVWGEHECMLERIVSGDAKSAESVAAAHVRAGAGRITKGIPPRTSRKA